MEKIKKVIIPCYKKNIYLTRICVASIRFFYPEIEIYLIKDLNSGDFSTDELEKNLNVKILAFERKIFGWGFAALELLFLKTYERVLLLDPDTVFIGKVLDNLEHISADLIVSGTFTEKVKRESIRNCYFDYEKVLAFDKNYKYPGFLFNTGQLVIKTGLFERSEFENLMEWNKLPKLKHPEIFWGANQGILNYMIGKRKQEKSLSVENCKFMLWGQKKYVEHLDLERIIDKSNIYPYLIHWAGTCHFLVDKMCRSDILTFFENYYYSNVPWGKFKKRYRTTLRKALWLIKTAKGRVLM